MKFARWLLFAVAAVPALAPFGWCWLAAQLPEPWLERRAVGDAETRWTFKQPGEGVAADSVEVDVFAQCLDVQHEPAHVLARATHLGLLHVPGSTIGYVALFNAALALLIVGLLAGRMRATAGLGATGAAFAVAAAGLLAGSPAHGANWLHGERLGRFLAPLLLLFAFSLLARDARFGWRALLVLALAAAAPFCHDHGAFVFVAVLPALLEAGARTGSARTVAWVVACLLVGNVAAAISLVPAAPLSLSGNGLLGQFVAAPLATGEALLRATGACWLDVLPGSTRDELVLGALSWVLPVGLWLARERTPEARRAMAPWWGCVLFGLALVVWHAERHGFSVAAPAMRELTFGSFLLPVGLVGLLAARCGAAVWPAAFGALLLLGVQDWRTGIVCLRAAVAETERTTTLHALPEWMGGPRASREQPTRTIEQLQALEKLGWVPAYGESLLVAFEAAVEAAPDESFGTCTGGDALQFGGSVRARLWPAPVTGVVVGVELTPGKYVPAGYTLLPTPGEWGTIGWSVAVKTPLADGARVRAFGVVVRTGAVVRLGPTFVLRDGELVVEAGP